MPETRRRVADRHPIAPSAHASGAPIATVGPRGSVTTNSAAGMIAASIAWGTARRASAESWRRRSGCGCTVSMPSTVRKRVARSHDATGVLVVG